VLEKDVNVLKYVHSPPSPLPFHVSRALTYVWLTLPLYVSSETCSSFELYKEEVMSGNLVWSLVHRSEKFWRENVGRFEENNFKVLGVLLELIRSSNNPQVLAIACYDLGEFVRFHPRGRKYASPYHHHHYPFALVHNPFAASAMI
jgi:hypothetical protein